MGRSCCVPGCKSNYKASDTSTFQFPRDKKLREKWVKCIHRDCYEVTANSFVCIKHFEDKFVVREDVFPVIGGDSIIIPRKKPKLREDAYPTIFPNQPSYHSVSAPTDRQDPAVRSQKVLARDEQTFLKWCENDMISNFDSFRTEVMKRNVKPFMLSVHDDYILFFKLRDEMATDIPLITISFKVTSSLDVKIFFKNTELSTANFKWILQTEDGLSLKCDRWTKFENLVSHLQSYNDETLNVGERVEILVNFLTEALESNTFDDEKLSKIKFSLEQLTLSLKKQNRYSNELIIWAATLSFSFPGAYKAIRETNVLTLPHHTYLKHFLGKIGPISTGISPSHKAFLHEKSKLLQNEDKVVSVILDEIYLNSKITYSAGKVLGMAENTTDVVSAGTMQVFMLSSLHTKYKDLIGLFPVKNLQSDSLYDLTIEVLTTMNDLGFHVVCLVSDNHRINRKMFELLCGGSLKTCVPNPTNPTKPIFLLFDSVHLLKSIRNNWLNCWKSTFSIPSVEQVFSAVNTLADKDESVTLCQYTTTEAKFSDLRDIFKSEQNMVLKLAPTLNRKALYPTLIERQSVSLAVNIFNYKNVVALETLKNQGILISDGTIDFLKLIIKWWTIVNVKHPMKGNYQRNVDAAAICGANDSKLVFLEDLRVYLDVWHRSSNVKGKLSDDTHIAVTHTLKSMVALCKYIFNTYGWSYILTAKFQSDCLEGRFSSYRRLSGCGYNISAEQVLEAERKIKVISLLKLKSAKFGEINLNDFALTVEESSEALAQDNLECLESAINEVPNVSISPETQKVLICIASYTSKKVLLVLDKQRICDECHQMLQSHEEMHLDCEKEMFQYFKELNRGGLKCPSSFMITLAATIYALFQTLISNTFEKEFLKLKNQQNAVITLGIQIYESSVNDVDKQCTCGVTLIKIVKKCVKVLSNIFINNYHKVLNERHTSRELAKKLEAKRKKSRKSELRNKGEKLKLQKFTN